MTGWAITYGVASQVNDHFVSSFSGVEGAYILETHLETDENEYYVVASIKGDGPRSRLVSAVLDIEGENGVFSKSLGAGDLRSVDCGIFAYCKEQVLKSFSVRKNGFYKLKVRSFSAVGEVEVLSLNLHSNHSIIFQAVFTVIGLALLVTGMFMVVIRVGIVASNVLLSRVKRRVG